MARCVLGLLSVAALLSEKPADALVLPPTIAAAAARLRGRQLRCGIHFIASDCAPPNATSPLSPSYPNSCASYGSGFAYTAQQAVFDRVAAAPWDSLVPLAENEVLGSTVKALQYVADVSGLNLTFYAARLPPRIMNDSDSTKHYLYMQDKMGLDCSAYAVTHQFERKHYMRYSQPFQPYGFQVVGQRAGVVPDPIVKQMFHLLEAFQPEVWGLTVASTLISAPIMTFFERDHGRSDFARFRKEGLTRQLGEAVYLSVLGLSEHDFFESVTPAGRMYTAFQAMFLFLLMAFYDAKLAAFLSIPATAVQPLKSVTDFGRLGLSACVRNHGNTINFLRGSYPEIPLKIFPSLPDAFHAFEAGKCGGVIAVDLEVLYEMGPNDPAGHFCHIQPVGPKFGVAYYYAISFHMNRTTLTPSDLDAISQLMLYNQETYDYQKDGIDPFFPEVRPQCAGVESHGKGLGGHGATTLALVQVAGIFVVLGAGMAGASVYKIWRLFLAWARRGGVTLMAKSAARVVRKTLANPLKKGINSLSFKNSKVLPVDEDDEVLSMKPHVVEYYKDTNERVHHLLMHMTHAIEMLDLLPKNGAAGAKNGGGNGHQAAGGNGALNGIREDDAGVDGDSAGRRDDSSWFGGNGDKKSAAVSAGLPERVFPYPITDSSAASRVVVVRANGPLHLVSPQHDGSVKICA